MTIAKAFAKLVEDTPDNKENAVMIIEAAGAVVTAATILIQQAKSLVGEVDTQAVAQGLKAGANGIAKNAGKAAGEAAEKADLMFAKLGDTKDQLLEGLAQAKSEKELRKAIRDARQSALENSTMTMAVTDFLNAKEKAGESGIGPLNNLPGCFVIATYRKLDFDKDLTDYTSLYIGRTDNIAEGVETAISREGDPDVYADVKYKQNVHIYVYNCLPEELDSLEEGLLMTFNNVEDEGSNEA